MPEAPAAARSRDPDRTRESILNAAEDLFATIGYDAVSLQMIGERAGVSRGTPGYFFGSKESLYNSVLERIFAAELAFVGAAHAAATVPGTSTDITISLDAVIGGFLEFLGARSSFVRLLDRESLAGGALLRATPAHAQSIAASRSIAGSILSSDQVRQVDPTAFMLALVALCWFPFTHAETYARPLGIDMANHADRERWRRHLVDLVLNGIVATKASEPT